MNVDDLPERLRARVSVDVSGCWVWIGSMDAYGYGRISSGRTSSGGCRKQRAHRLTYEALVGPIPEGLVIDHLCRRTACVRPDHLEPVTNSENARRGNVQAAKTHCPYGHEYTLENTCLSGGRRHCRACFRRKDWARRGIPKKYENSSGEGTALLEREPVESESHRLLSGRSPEPSHKFAEPGAAPQKLGTGAVQPQGVVTAPVLSTLLRKAR